jgi:hypothetical protein
MPTLTGSDTYFTNISASFTATKWEALIDQAIDKINGYARQDLLPNMAGTVGSKSVSVTSGQAGWIRQIATVIYRKDTLQKGAVSNSFSVAGVSTSTSTTNNEIDDMAKNAALNLREMEVSLG